MLACGAAASAQVAADEVASPLTPTRLYLRSGAIDTSRAADGLAALARQIRGDGRAVLQLDGPMTPERRAKLEAAGVRIGEYLPKDAFVVSLGNADAAALEGVDFVRWQGAYASEWKLDPDIGIRDYQTPERLEQTARGLVTVNIALFEGERDAKPTLDLLAGIPGAVTHFVDDSSGSLVVGATMSFNDTVLLTDLDQVMFVEDAPENTLRSNTNNRWIVQSNVVNVHPLYDNGLHGEGQIVGVIDGRIDQNHCSFVDGANPVGPLHRKLLAYNASVGAETHGTHVAGTAAGDSGANDNNRGIAYLAKIVFNTIAAQTEAGVTQRLDLHYSQGARVHTNSWGDDGTTAYTGQCRGIDAHVYANEESLVLFAVTNTSALKTPENAKNLLAVGASQGSPNQENFCSGGAGPTNDGRRKPEIYAPGCSTVSSGAGTACGTSSLTGTSMACPAVAGTATLVRQYYADGYYPSGGANPSDAFNPTAALVKATLLDSSVDMTGIAGYPSNQEGWGRVLADNALYFAGDARRLIAEDVRNADGLSTSDIVDVGVNVQAGQPLEVTLVWTEPAATVNTSFASVNDLDLEVIGPGGVTYLGNAFSGGQSTTGGAKDDRNNVEKVILSAPATGAWVVRIKGTAVNVGTQGYALVVTGDVSSGPRPLSIAMASTPATIAPGATTPVTVTINPGDDTLVGGSPEFFYRFDGGVFASSALTPLGGDLWGATLPAPDCGDIPEFFASAAGAVTGTISSPAAGATGPRTALVGTTSFGFADDMETSTGWVVGAPGDAATTGVWVRVDPVGSAAQPEDDTTSAPGVLCWVTGQGLVGGGLGDNDVDGGATTLLTPVFDLSTYADPTISFNRWYSNSAGASPNADTFDIAISNDGGGSWTAVETVGPAGAGTGGGWVSVSFQPGSLLSLTNTMRMRFVASDLGAGSIIEAGVDDFVVTDFNCVSVTPPCCPGNADKVAPGIVDFDDVTQVLANWSASYPDSGPGDADCDGDVDFDDVTSVLTNFGAGCP